LEPSKYGMMVMVRSLISGGSAIGLSATGAWLAAAAGDDAAYV
jgi:hypothetical protein